MAAQLTKFTIKDFAGMLIKFRDSDGYLNANDICNIKEGKKYSVYIRLVKTKKYLVALEEHLGISADLLVDVIKTGPYANRCAWIHPQIAIHLARWVSPQFAAQVSNWVFRAMTGDLTMITELVANHDAINNTHSKTIISTLPKQQVLNIQDNEELEELEKLVIK